MLGSACAKLQEKKEKQEKNMLYKTHTSSIYIPEQCIAFTHALVSLHAVAEMLHAPVLGLATLPMALAKL